MHGALAPTRCVGANTVRRRQHGASAPTRGAYAPRSPLALPPRGPVAGPGPGGLAGRGGPGGRRPGGARRPAQPPALLRRGRVQPLAAPGARLLAAARGHVHRGPGPALGLFLRHAAILVPLLDMLGHSLLLLGVGALVSAWHCLPPLVEVSGPVPEPLGPVALGAVGAAINDVALLRPVADPLAPAVGAGRGQGVDGALEAVEGVGLAPDRDCEGLVVLVPADVALAHDRSPAFGLPGSAPRRRCLSEIAAKVVPAAGPTGPG